MDDSRLFAILTPLDELGLARRAIGLTENADFYYKAVENYIVEEPAINNKESTLAPPSFSASSSDGIVLSFNTNMKNPYKG